MIIFLKFWSKKVEIIGASNALLSSYALTLMVIAFLQSTSPPVLPCLQEKKLLDRQHKRITMYPVPIGNLRTRGFRKQNQQNTDSTDQKPYCLTETDTFFEQDLKIIQEFYMPKERNTKSVSELLFDFFYFFSYQFNSNSQVIDVKNSKGFTPKISKDLTPFTIVDPFEQQRNPGSSVLMNSKGHKKIMMHFRSALDQFVVEK